MNGLEAIRLMEQGKMIESDSYFTRYIKDGVMYSVTPDGDVVSNDFDINYEEYRECKHKPLTGWERVEDGERYRTIDECSVWEYREDNDGSDVRLYNIANYFSTKEKAEEINFKQTLFRRLQRFSDENGGLDINWNNCEEKFCIYYNYEEDELDIGCNCFTREYGQVYFISEEVAKIAIELFRDELIKYFTQYK